MEAPGPQHLSAADGFVLTMLSMMFLSLSVIGVLIFCMKRHAARRDPHVDLLLEELADAEKTGRRTAALREKPTAEPWERDGDWWKS